MDEDKAINLEPGALENILRVMAEQIGKINGERAAALRFKSYEEMVLALGKPYKGARRPKGVRKKPNRRCFENALKLALDRDNLTYVEGYGSSHVVGIPVLHAWCVTGDGTVVDPTWGRPDLASYYGIALDLDAVARVVLAQGCYGVIGNDWMNDQTMIRTGEVRVSDRLKLKEGDV